MNIHNESHSNNIYENNHEYLDKNSNKSFDSNNSICEIFKYDGSFQLNQFLNKEKINNEDDLNSESDFLEKNFINFIGIDEPKSKLISCNSKLNSDEIFKNKNKEKIEEKIEEKNIDNKNEKNNQKHYNKKDNLFIVKKVFDYVFYPSKTRKVIKNIIFPKFNISTNKNYKLFKKNYSRKFQTDNIRKRIKTRFLKILKNKVNDNLKKAKSEKLFTNLPQCFIKEITKERIKRIINKTLKELLSTNFYEEYKKEENNFIEILKSSKNKDVKNYKKNKEVLEYLEKNKEICEKSKFDIIGNMTFKELFEQYLKSKDFEDDVSKLKEKRKYNKKKDIYETENSQYIRNYIIYAFGFINYFSNSD